MVGIWSFRLRVRRSRLQSRPRLDKRRLDQEPGAAATKDKAWLTSKEKTFLGDVLEDLAPMNDL